MREDTESSRKYQRRPLPIGTLKYCETFYKTRNTKRKGVSQIKRAYYQQN